MEKERTEEPLSLEGEIWKPVVGYEEFYDVSNFGRVRNIFIEIFRIHPYFHRFHNLLTVDYFPPNIFLAYSMSVSIPLRASSLRIST